MDWLQTLTLGINGEMDVAEASDSGTAEKLLDSADPMDLDGRRFGGGPAVKTLPRASRCCATDLHADQVQASHMHHTTRAG